MCPNIKVNNVGTSSLQVPKKARVPGITADRCNQDARYPIDYCTTDYKSDFIAMFRQLRNKTYLIK